MRDLQRKLNQDPAKKPFNSFLRIPKYPSRPKARLNLSISTITTCNRTKSTNNCPTRLPSIKLPATSTKRPKLGRSFTYQVVPENLLSHKDSGVKNFNVGEIAELSHSINVLARVVKLRIDDIFVIGSLINFGGNTLKTAVQLAEDTIVKVANKETIRENIERTQIKGLKEGFIEDKIMKRGIIGKVRDAIRRLENPWIMELANYLEHGAAKSTEDHLKEIMEEDIILQKKGRNQRPNSIFKIIEYVFGDESSSKFDANFLSNLIIKYTKGLLRGIMNIVTVTYYKESVKKPTWTRQVIIPSTTSINKKDYLQEYKALCRRKVYETLLKQNEDTAKEIEGYAQKRKKGKSNIKL